MCGLYQSAFACLVEPCWMEDDCSNSLARERIIFQHCEENIEECEIGSNLWLHGGF